MSLRTAARCFLCLLFMLAGCTAAETATPIASPEPSATQHPPTPTPAATVVLPVTWTPAPTASPRPSPTLHQWTSTPPPAPTIERWPPHEIPAVTLTPTPPSAVPAAATALYEQARRAVDQNDLERAAALVDSALELAPYHADYWQLRGLVALLLDHPLEGEAHLRQALSIDPFHAGARQTLADLYGRYGRLREAAIEYTHYLTLAPHDPVGWYELGRIRERQGRTIEAIASYSRTLELDPSHSAGLVSRLGLRLQEKEYRAAWLDVSSLIVMTPTAALYHQRGEINIHLETPLLAAADFEAELELLASGTSTYTLLMQIGRAYLEGAAPLPAAATFQRAISLTTTLEPRIWLGESYLVAQEYPGRVGGL